MGYFISYQTVDSRTVSNTTTSYNVSSVVISGLRVGEKYGFTVACETEAGAGPASDIVYEPGKNIHVLQYMSTNIVYLKGLKCTSNINPIVIYIIYNGSCTCMYKWLNNGYCMRH